MRSLRLSLPLLALLALAAAACSSGPTTTTSATGPASTPTPHPEPAPEPTQPHDAVQLLTTSHGALSLVPIEHASFALHWGNQLILVDPVSAAFNAAAQGPFAATLEQLPPADLVLVTDLHGDHLDPDLIATLRTHGAPVIAPAASATDLVDPTLLANGESVTLFDDLTITAVPMYNLVRTRPDSGELFHVPGRGNGYLLTRGQTTVYIAGDTECTPEMKALRDVDLAFVPMNLPYTMPLEEAAECVRAFRPAQVLPYHHRGQDPHAFAALLADLPDVSVTLLDWYPTSDAATGEKAQTP